MHLCGPKLSILGIILSVWGIIQLGLLGIFYYYGAVALSEDLPELELTDVTTVEFYYSELEDKYMQNAYNCWVATFLYLATLIFSAQQYWFNKRSSLSV
ncbi:hypothetical protein HHI36_001296 [Cryptolaemus montrouzieri]|uniref:Uncharacterized protein n=1 Tax=Cryptolaemus montrouzieri TaxID=559131 RepID=A0ABD2P778_9CUCU